MVLMHCELCRGQSQVSVGHNFLRQASCSSWCRTLSKVKAIAEQMPSLANRACSCNWIRMFCFVLFCFSLWSNVKWMSIHLVIKCEFRFSLKSPGLEHRRFYTVFQTALPRAEWVLTEGLRRPALLPTPRRPSGWPQVSSLEVRQRPDANSGQSLRSISMALICALTIRSAPSTPSSSPAVTPPLPVGDEVG